MVLLGAVKLALLLVITPPIEMSIMAQLSNLETAVLTLDRGR